MALPGHSPPPPYTGPGSPSRILNGHLDKQLPQMYGPPTRSMLPPSPQNYRFPQPPPIPSASPSLPAMGDNRIVPPYKRPGSSMSISSMLGGEPEKSMQDMYLNHNPRGPSRQGIIPALAPNQSSIMSPPYQPTKPGLGEYSYKPRSQTPDRIGPSLSMAGTRQRSSSSGTPLQRSAPFADSHARSASTIPAPRYLEQPPNPFFDDLDVSKNEQDDRVRRTSLSGILQRPSSQPQSGQAQNQRQDPFGQRSATTNPPDRQIKSGMNVLDPFHRNGLGSTYDIKPPVSHSVMRASGPQMSPTRAPSLPNSPDMRRSGGIRNQGRSLASILNGPSSHPPELTNTAAQKMSRQDSSQSQSDRSLFGDRSKGRQYSPFANPLIAQGHPSSGTPTDDQGRKGSDELSQHRTLLGLGAETKRGRFSPMPQVMQGAQAQTPVPESATKTEHGRVFSGLGGGIGSTPTPTGVTRRDDGRTPLSEDNLKKISRATPSLNKRSRKLQDEDTNGDTDMSNGVKTPNGRANKKSKYQHSYKLDVDETGIQAWQRRSTPLTGFNPSRNTNTSSTSGQGGAASAQQPSSQRNQDKAPVLKPRKIVKVAAVFNSASRTPRRHLGTFTYRPDIVVPERRLPTLGSNASRFEVGIRPNLLPSFSAVEHVNCTYTLHVPRMWLQERERSLICTEHCLWGSGIYTDDSDPVAAAMHAGFLKASFSDNVDTNLLTRVIKEQTPKIEWPRDIKVPEQPMEVQPGKDLKITMVVLPLLEQYESSARYGVISRMWPEGVDKAQHDGVSFAILKIEFVNVGKEEMRMGRTGVSKRERLRADLEARQRGLKLQSEKIEQARKRKLAQIKARLAVTSNPDANSRSELVPITTTRGSKPISPAASSSPLSRELLLDIA